ncbi:MAG: PPC domain-containing DNA-binding protein [Calditrichota bacterium]
MKYVEDKDRFLVRFEVGETLPDALVGMSGELGWTSGSLTGIGGVKDVVLAYYDLAAREYLKFPVAGIVELVSLAGNLALVEDKPFWHLHASVANVKGEVTAGHLVSLTVAITLECWIQPGIGIYNRKYDESCGLNLLSI